MLDLRWNIGFESPSKLGLDKLPADLIETIVSILLLVGYFSGLFLLSSLKWSFVGELLKD